jgi:hypothetical protein
MKSKNFQKSQNKAEIGQKSKNWPKRSKFSKKTKKKPKKPILAFFLENLSFFGNFLIFWKFFDFLEIF